MDFNYLNEFPWTSQSKNMQRRKNRNLGKMVLCCIPTKRLIKFWGSKYIYRPFKINFRKMNSIIGIGMCL